MSMEIYCQLKRLKKWCVKQYYTNYLYIKRGTNHINVYKWMSERMNEWLTTSNTGQSSLICLFGLLSNLFMLNFPHHKLLNVYFGWSTWFLAFSEFPSVSLTCSFRISSFLQFPFSSYLIFGFFLPRVLSQKELRPEQRSIIAHVEIGVACMLV